MNWNPRPYEWVGDWSARRASLSPDREAIVDELPTSGPSKIDRQAVADEFGE